MIGGTHSPLVDGESGRVVAFCVPVTAMNAAALVS
jgi:hypothetical protein